MLKVYLDKEHINDKEIIDENDIVFDYDLHTNLEVTNEIKKIMHDVDDATYENGMDMRSKYGNITSMENLSTGCKTMINIINHPDAVIDCIECGDNVLHNILKMKEGNILLTFLPSNSSDTINIIVNDIKNCSSISDLIAYANR